MSHPAEAIVIRGGRARRFVDRWSGARALDALAAGPDGCEAYCEAFTEEREQRADVEAGWLVDFDRRVVLCFGDPSTGYMGETAAERIAADATGWEAVVRPEWPGYALSWVDGSDALAAHVKKRGIVIEPSDEDVERLRARLARLREELPSQPPAAAAPPQPAPKGRAPSSKSVMPLLLCILPFALLTRLVTLPIRGWLLDRMRRRRRAARVAELEAEIARLRAGAALPARLRRAPSVWTLLGWSFLALAGLIAED